MLSGIFVGRRRRLEDCYVRVWMALALGAWWYCFSGFIVGMEIYPWAVLRSIEIWRTIYVLRYQSLDTRLGCSIVQTNMLGISCINSGNGWKFPIRTLGMHRQTSHRVNGVPHKT